MRFWFAHSSEVPIRRQIVTQVVLAILSGELKPGERLPSTRELARRFALHSNTVSAGYRQLEQEGWTEHRRGGGVFIRANADTPVTPEQIIDQHISNFFNAARQLNLPPKEVRDRVALWIAAPPPDHFVLIEPDPEVRRILLTELNQITAFPTVGAPLEDPVPPETLTAAIPLCRPSKTRLVRATLPMGVELVTLPIRSHNAWMSPWLPAPADSLIAVVSHWPEFLATARTMLVASGLAPDAIVVRDARKPTWRHGLANTTAILCDAYTATLPTLPRKPPTLVFHFLADYAAADLEPYTHPRAL